MRKLITCLTVTLSLYSLVVSVEPEAIKCERMDQRTSHPNTDEEDITSTSDYLELHNKIIEKVPTVDHQEKPNIDNHGNVYFQKADQLFVHKPSERKTFSITGIKLKTDRSTGIFIDRKFNSIFIGTHNGLFFLTCNGTRAVQLAVTNNITVDFGVIDSKGSVYFGTDGSNTDPSERLYVFHRRNKTLTRIRGIETSLGSYPTESQANRNKIAVDSKDNVYVGAFSSYVYLVRPGDSVASRIKENADGSVTAIVVDGKDNVYCRTYADVLVFKKNKFSKIIETVDYFDLFLAVDGADNLHFRIADEEFVLKTKDISAVEIPTETILLNKNLMVRNNIFYFTTSGESEKLFAIKQFTANATEIHRTKKFHSVAVDADNNLYFTADSSKIPNKTSPHVLRANAKMPIEIRGITSRLGNAYADDKNNIYFTAANGLHVLNFDEVVPHRLRATGSQVNSLVVAGNGNVYFGTDYDGAYVLRTGESEAMKVNGTGDVRSGRVEIFMDGNFDEIVYIQANNNLYILGSGDAVALRVISGNSDLFYLSDCRHNFYYLNGNEVFLIKSGELTARKISTTFGRIYSFDIDSSHRLYFGTNLGLQVMYPGETVASVVTVNDKSIATNTTASVLAIDRDGNIYFGMNGGAFVLKSGEQQAVRINGVDGEVVRIFVNNFDIFFITNEGRRLFLLRNKLELSVELFAKRNLGEIDDDNDETIFNALNYLNIENNYLLNRIKNVVVNKTETSATIVAKRGKYVGGFGVQYKITDRNENGRKYFVDLDFLKKAIYFNYVNDHLFHYRKTKEIMNIDVYIDNLRFSPVAISKKSDLSLSFDFKNVCDMKVVANSSPINQIYKFPECNYTGKEIFSFQITTGINKPDDGSMMKPVLTPDDEIIVSDFLYNNESSDHPVMLSTAFELSNANFFTQERHLFNFVEPEQDIVVPPKKKILVKYSVRSFTNKVVLNLRQKVHGVIVAKVRDNIDEQIIQITLRNAMQVLDKYSQLPIEVVINDDNSITFNGRAILASSSESKPNVIRNFIDAGMT